MNLDILQFMAHVVMTVTGTVISIGMMAFVWWMVNERKGGQGDEV